MSLPTMHTIAAYRFVPLDNLGDRRAALLDKCRSLELKGTILIASEGINLFLAGEVAQVRSFVEWLTAEPEFTDLPVKYNPCDYQPFNRLLVRVKKEIIPLGMPEIRPDRETSPKISPSELKSWLDERRDVLLLDVRNDYEIDVGTFAGAQPAGIGHFRDFPQAVAQFPEQWRERPIVMFCTGGIRCEKAGPVMQQAGFRHIWQLDGGILKYFEDCGGEHYRGDCFVFDQRVAVRPNLHEAPSEVCFHCRAVLSADDLQRPEYRPPHTCHHCFQSPEQTMQARLGRREQQLRAAVTPLPGSIPYDNFRPLHVPAALDALPVSEVLLKLVGHWGAEYWKAELAAGHVLYQGRALMGHEIARAGWRIEHRLPQTREPDVSTDIRLVYEDQWLVIVDKPSPLPVHPCGRFNRNSLSYFLNQVYRPEVLRPAHRLDADTTGLLVFSRTRHFARQLQPMFERNEVLKHYLAQVLGHPKPDQFVCDLPLSSRPNAQGQRQAVDVGLPSITNFRVLSRLENGTALLECQPQTGRTNQIRIHLAELGHPIVGDRWYGPCHHLRAMHEPTRDVKEVASHESAANSEAAPSRLMLHASRLAFRHPFTKKWVEFQSDRKILWMEGALDEP
ncbi:MAG TPA: pseudouridine synthase [Pirellulaceae bacterium]|nr:pseudouridine synthase [Pirellulaceae bacterium]